MKKNFVILLAVLSMFFFVSCGGDDEEPEKSEKNGGQNDTEQVNDADSEENDNGQTDVKDDADDEPAETADDDAEEPAETPDNNDEPIDDSKCETVVYKSMDLLVYDVNEINIWFYDLETYEDTTPPLFFAELKFAKNVDELKGETVSLKGSDPNKEDGNRVFLYKKPYTAEEENFIAKTGEIHIEDVNEGNIKIKTTDIIFSAILISDTEEDYVWIEDPNGKCYKLEALEWDSISAAGE